MFKTLIKQLFYPILVFIISMVGFWAYGTDMMHPGKGLGDAFMTSIGFALAAWTTKIILS